MGHSPNCLFTFFSEYNYCDTLGGENSVIYNWNRSYSLKGAFTESEIKCMSQNVCNKFKASRAS